MPCFNFFRGIVNELPHADFRDFGVKHSTVPST